MKVNVFLIEAIVTVTNWEGTSSTHSSVMEVHSKDADPVLRAVGSTTVHLEHPGKTLRLEVSTGQQVPACNSMIVVWEYQRELVAATDIRPMAVWSDYASIESLGFVDASRSPNVLSLERLSLIAGTVQRFRASATFDPDSEIASRPLVEFYVTVGPYPDTDVAIEGPTRSIVACGFTLDGSKTIDPLFGPENGIEGLTFQWMCPQEACNKLPSFAEGMVRGYAGSLEPVLVVEGGQLPAGTYTFTLRVGRAAYGGASMRSTSVKVDATGTAPAQIAAPWTRSGTMPADAASAEVVATIGVVAGGVGSGCVAPANTTWRFVIVDNPFRTPSLVVAVLNSTTVRSGGMATVTTLVFPVAALTVGTVYAYALLQASSEAILDGVKPGWLTAQGVEMAGFSTYFVLDQFPYPGNVAVAPLVGEAARTEYEFVTEAWFDEDIASLQYAFFWFPLAVYFKLMPNFNATKQFTAPPIEWDDTESPRHWARLGGVKLRDWSSAPSARAALRSGASFIVARGRDKAGMSRAAVALGPTCKEPDGGLSAGEVESLLSRAAADNNAEQLWATVDAIVSVMQKGNVVSASGQMDLVVAQSSAALLLAALESSAELAERSETSLEHIGGLVAATLAGLHAAGGTALQDLSRAVGALEGAVELVPATGLSSSGAVPMLTAVAAVGTDLRRGGGDALVNGKVAAVTSSLSKGLLRKMQPGSKQDLLAIDASGDTTISLSLEQTLQRTTTTTYTTTSSTATSTGSTSTTTGTTTTTTRTTTTTKTKKKRRLDAATDAGGTCETLGVAEVEWTGFNPLSVVKPEVGFNGAVPSSARILTLEFLDLCSWAPLPSVSGAFDLPQLRLPLGAVPPPVQGFNGTWPADPARAAELLGDAGWTPCPVCLYFDTKAGGIWTIEGVELTGNWTLEAIGNFTEIECLPLRGAGSYTMVYTLVPVNTTCPQELNGGAFATTTAATGQNLTLPEELADSELTEAAAFALPSVSLPVLLAVGFFVVFATAAAVVAYRWWIGAAGMRSSLVVQAAGKGCLDEEAGECPSHARQAWGPAAPEDEDKEDSMAPQQSTTAKRRLQGPFGKGDEPPETPGSLKALRKITDHVVAFGDTFRQEATLLEAARLGEVSIKVYKERIIEVYSQCNPDKLADVDRLMAKYKGQEHSLYLRICAKYQVQPEPEVRSGLEPSPAAPNTRTRASTRSSVFFAGPRREDSDVPPVGSARSAGGSLPEFVLMPSLPALAEAEPLAEEYQTAIGRTAAVVRPVLPRARTEHPEDPGMVCKPDFGKGRACAEDQATAVCTSEMLRPMTCKIIL